MNNTYQMNDKYIELAALLDFDKETGRFRWLNTDAVHVSFRDKSAGTIYKSGYEYIRHKNHTFLSHRLAWFMVFGEMPSGMLDHINMIRSDNRIQNLRQASLTENNRNKKLQANNTTGHKGVARKAPGKYQVRIYVNNRCKYLGSFSSITDAANAYKKAAEEFHGEFARVI